MMVSLTEYFKQKDKVDAIFIPLFKDNPEISGKRMNNPVRKDRYMILIDAKPI